MSDQALRRLEERVARLEEELRRLKTLIAQEPGQPWWERTAGLFRDSKTYKAVVREGRKIRRADREKGRGNRRPTSPRNGAR